MSPNYHIRIPQLAVKRICMLIRARLRLTVILANAFARYYSIPLNPYRRDFPF